MSCSPRFKAAVFLSAAVALLLLVLPSRLHASTYTYDLPLTDAGNPTFSGTGVITLSVNGPLSTYTPYYTSNGLTGLSFIVDGQTYSLGDVSVNHSTTLAEFSQLNPTAAIFVFTPASPEPASLALLATGLLGRAGTLERRLRS